MKNKTKSLLIFLFLFSWSWAGAEEISVKVAGDRSAVVHVTDTESADPDISGMMKGSADLKAGKSAFKADLVLKDAAELQGAKAGLYSSMTNKTIEAIGFIDAKIPADPNGPKVLDINAETVTEGDQSAAKFSINVAGPNNDDSVPTGSGSMNLSGDVKSLKSNGEFSFSGGDIKAEEAPFKNFSIDITEVENKTTVSFEIKAAKDSDMAAQLDGIPQMAPMVEQQLKQAGLKYEGLDFPAPTEEGDLKVGKGTITIIAVRDTIRPFLGFAAGGLQAEMGPDVDVKGAMENMLEVKFDKFSFALNVDGEKLDGTFDVNMSNLDKFYEGYLVILPAVQKQQNQEMAYEMGEFGPMFIAFMELNTEQGIKAIKAAIQSNMTIEGDAKFSLEPKEQDLSFTASGSLLTSNYQNYLAKAKEMGLPVAEKAVGFLNLKMEDQTALKGDMYLYTDGDLVSYYKSMLGSAADSSGAPKDVVDAINALELNEIGMKLNLQDNKLVIEGKGDTSDLTKVSDVIISKAAAGFDAKLTGAHFEANMPEGAQGNVDFKAFFSEFMPGKNEAQIKEGLGLPSSATVTLDAPAEEAKLVAIEAPELTIDGALADVQASGQELLASSPADMGGSGGGGGGSNWGLIALGALILVGVGGFLMFKK